ncbi:MAG: hypothetical protein HC767_12875 [Akkermansiaceae bacterium]|nr:hypothetical protein [Akkermansiaceae bacterium]
MITFITRVDALALARSAANRYIEGGSLAREVAALSQVRSRTSAPNARSLTRGGMLTSPRPGSLVPKEARLVEPASSYGYKQFVKQPILPQVENMKKEKELCVNTILRLLKASCSTDAMVRS